jgi:S-adenosylmethionine-diacylgycerolhomoserine-N-methlytransferase
VNGAEMDAIYRLQRHFYDLTRKPYLLGRDILIHGLAVPPGGTVLEIGCGTARNLLCIARRYPTARCFGIDVSSVMLETARAAIARDGAGGRVTVRLADATQFDPAARFGIARFDRVVISYALSMIPDWEAALATAAGFLAPGGQLHIADFGDQHGLPGWFRKALFAWLGMFSVTPRLTLRERADAVARAFGYDCRFRSVYRGYTALAELRAGRA